MDSLIDGILVWWLQKGRYTWSKFRRKYCERKYSSGELPEVDSLEDIEACLKKVTWTMDGPLHLFDSISYPQRVWAKKKDDCDGFAVLSAALLNRLSKEYEPVLITVMMRPVKASHTVCAFKVTLEDMWFFDNYTLRRGECKTYDYIEALVSQRGKRVICWDVRDPETFDMIEFHRI